MNEEEFYTGTLRSALANLSSPASLIALIPWFVAASFALPGVPPLLLLLIAAWLASATGTSWETIARARLRGPRTRAVADQIAYLVDESLQIPPRFGVPIRTNLQAVYAQVQAGVLPPDQAQETLDRIRADLVKQQAKFLSRSAAGEVPVHELQSISAEAERYREHAKSTFPGLDSRSRRGHVPQLESSGPDEQLDRPPTGRS